jgi:folate-dependent tRNA-U54 methylase TrmFO/GidA
MNVNFGLFPPPGRGKAHDRKKALSSRALNDLNAWIAGAARHAAE